VTPDLSCVPIIIVGAGRSGTKMLRSILSSHSEIVSFPREINYIWRHGNATYPTDELRIEHARPEVIHYIRKHFRVLSERHQGARVVEKTCANALRVDFVHAIFPEAHIIHLVRDGRAVAESTRRRWTARPELRYIWEKARWLPWSDIPYYALRYLRYQLGRVHSDHGAGSSWGPRFSGIDGWVREKALIEVCGQQWKACVQAVTAAFTRLPPDQVTTLRYEDLVAAPVEVTERLFDRLDLTFTDESKRYVEHEVRSDYVNKWRSQLTERDLDLLMPHIKVELLRQGYEI
jgi:hypothetical protein